MSIRPIRCEEAAIRVLAEPDHIPVEGNACASGDDDFDREVEHNILCRLQQGDIWAWAAVTVVVTWGSFEGRDHLGCCSYVDEEDFKQPCCHAACEPCASTSVATITQRPIAAAWIRICQARPDSLFWSYTRAWSVPAILPSIEALRSLTNVRLFASCDETMPLPPPGWRTAFVEEDPRAQGVHCRKQQGQAESCLTCGYCLFSDTGHVVFKVH